MSLSFGTDGVRGVANAELTPEFVLALGRAAARVLGRPGFDHPFLVGRDTRISGPLLQAALTAGLAAEGVDVLDLGVIPTPGVAAVASERQLPAAVISASHNPYRDNGIKFFSTGGRKLPDETEQKLEAELDLLLKGEANVSRSGSDLGRAQRLPKAHGWYAQRLVDTLDDRRLDGMKIVLDCANGAAHEVAPDAFRRAGAEVTVIHDRPDGLNINDHCGSTYPESLQQTVRDIGAHVGLAFDGDADRVLAVDENGDMVDGDQIIALCAMDLRSRGQLVNNTVVITVMTNLGFHLAMAREGINVVETKVGDRYVLEALEAGGHALGGEQSGHVVFREMATTGDGVLTGLHVADILKRSGRPFSQLSNEAMVRLPQVLRNIRVAGGRSLDEATAVWTEVKKVEQELGANGRVVLRASGTEPVVRVIVEAPTADEAQSATDRLCAVVESSLS